MATITHVCGHKRRVTLRGGTATSKSAQASDLALALCPQCAQTQREQKEAADAVYAEYVAEQERIAARRYRVTLHYDEHPTLDPRVMWEGTGFWVAAGWAQKRVMWEGTGFWVAAGWAQNAAKSLIATTAHAYVEHNAENTEYRAYRRNWAHNGQSYILVGHASVADVTDVTDVSAPARLSCHECGNLSGGTAWWWDTRLWADSANGPVCPVCLQAGKGAR